MKRLTAALFLALTLSAFGEGRARGPGNSYELTIPPGFTAEISRYRKTAKLVCMSNSGGWADFKYSPSEEPLDSEHESRFLAAFVKSWKGAHLLKNEPWPVKDGTGSYHEFQLEDDYRMGVYRIRTHDGLFECQFQSREAEFEKISSLMQDAMRSLTFLGAPADRSDAPPAFGISNLRLPSGFSIEVYCDTVPGARSMALGPDGTLYVGTMDKVVYALPDKDHHHKPDRVVTIAAGLDMPNGVAMRGNDLYIAEVSRVIRLKDIGAHLDDPPKLEVINDHFPKDRLHGWKFIAFGPDGMLYVPVGSPKNVCECPDPYAAISRMQPDGTGLEVFARGIRNTVGFDWDPKSHELWFTDNGRDMLGDDLPPEELNHASLPGLHFGYPYRYGHNLSDPQFGAKAPSGLDFVPPVVEFQAHSACLGMRFYQGAMLPANYQGKVLMASHGSWNRSVPTGYQVWMVDPVSHSRTVVVDGFLQGAQHWGRPVDVQPLEDGSVLISDDQAGCIYRLTYQK